MRKCFALVYKPGSVKLSGKRQHKGSPCIRKKTQQVINTENKNGWKGAVAGQGALPVGKHLHIPQVK